ncbi:hypothetical protein HanRHA438_Chr10g0437691 [Helianthus annuus]|nr:hypothetical protein HanRHA438_Chr10g0437691 [Helianthus annuus]
MKILTHIISTSIETTKRQIAKRKSLRRHYARGPKPQRSKLLFTLFKIRCFFFLQKKTKNKNIYETLLTICLNIVIKL